MFRSGIETLIFLLCCCLVLLNALYGLRFGVTGAFVYLMLFGYVMPFFAIGIGSLIVAPSVLSLIDSRSNKSRILILLLFLISFASLIPLWVKELLKFDRGGI